MNSTRSAFGNHAWVEVQLTGLQRYVVDITHALLDPSTNTNTPEYGTKLEPDYLASNRDTVGDNVGTWTGNQIVWTDNQTNGNCCMAPSLIL